MNETKLELYLDVDGVILDFEGAFVDFVRDVYLPDLPLDYALQTWEMAEEFQALDVQEVWERFISSDRFKRLGLLVDGTSFNALAAQFPIYLITNIPNDYYESRAENLKFHTLNYEALHLAGHYNFGDELYPSKSAAIRKLHIPGSKMIFLDDHPKNCLEIKNNFPESNVFLMSRPHNQKAEDPAWTRVADWNDFMSHV